MKIYYQIKSLFFSVTVLLLSSYTLFAQQETFYFSNEAAQDLSQRLSQERDISAFELVLPLSDGQQIRFLATENNVLSQEMSQDHPGIFSLDIVAVDNPSIFGKLTVVDDVLMGSIVTPQGMVTIVPSQELDNQLLSFQGAQHPELTSIESTSVTCDLDANLERITDRKITKTRSADLQSGSEIKTYRVALAVTGEFYELNGDNDNDVLAVVTYSINGANLIYENELGINFTIVSSPLLFNDRTTDPFSPDQAGGISRVDQARDVLNTAFSVADFDLGHVLHRSSSGDNWSGGGVAYKGVTCFDFGPDYGPYKAGAWSGSFNNLTFSWLSLFAHELGHQFDASHTFNGTGGSCFTNISDDSSVEIGSGTTIMSYNGICQADNNILSSGEKDNYFHTFSLTEMYNFTEAVTCGTKVPSGNNVPQVNANPSSLNYTIPVSTPFELEGSATDADGDSLTYNWEQMDEDGAGSRTTQGFLGATAAASTVAPLFRSFPPDANALRSFPSLSNILSGQNSGQTFEALPSVARSMTFAFNVRDNHSGAGALAYELVTVDVEDNGGAFEVTSQNTPTTYTYDGTSTMTVQWNVAGTTGGGIACNNVDIYFSTDDGETFPYLLASSTPNDGNETFTVPIAATTSGRIKIKGTNHIFFDINNSPITINSSCETKAATFTSDDALEATEGSAALDFTLMPQYGNVMNNIAGTLEATDPEGTLAGYDESTGNCINYSNITYNDVYSFQVNETGTYIFSRPSGVSTLSIYQEEFFPSGPCTNILGSTVTLTTILSNLTIDLQEGVTYLFVVNSYFSGQQTNNSYSISYSGPGQLYDGIPSPGAGYTYAYAIANNTTGNVVAYQNDPDLTDVGLFPAGSYQVVGVSYDVNTLSLTTLNDSYTGILLSDLRSAIITQDLCLDVSPNSKEITINGIEVTGPVALNASVLLQGALSGGASNIMRDDLRSLGYLPTDSPYPSAPLSTMASVINTNAGTDDAIVDWVLVELRNHADPSQVSLVASALLQRDGDIVSPVDGTSLLSFTNLPQSSFFVAIRHRNHLGVMSATPISFLGSTVNVDFINSTSADIYHSTSVYDGNEMVQVNGQYALWAGDANQDGKVKYQGSDNDSFTIFTESINHPANVDDLYSFNGATGYYSGDVNLDGKVKYLGVEADTLLIFFNLLGSYPLNTTSLYTYDLFLEQIP